MSRHTARKHVDFDNLPHPLVVMENLWPAASSTGWHSHPRGQLLYAITGVMVIDSQAGTWVVPPNRALWMVAGLPHNVTMSGDVEMRTAYIDAQKVEGLPAGSCVINVSPLLRELLVEGARVPVGRERTARERRLFELIVDELNESSAVALHLSMPASPRLQAVCRAIVERPSDPRSAAEWAAAAHVGERTLHRLFVKETGMTFAQWREQARLLFALRSIAEGRKVLEVALDCGYASQSAFSAMFRRHFGAAPSSFYR